MPAVGTKIRERTAPADRSIAAVTGTAFVAGIAQRGRTNAAKKVTSMAEFEAEYGTRQSYSSLWDVVDNIFREGADSVYVARVVGPAAALGAGLNLLDAGAAISLVVTPKNVGDWSATRRIQVQTTTDDASIAASQFKIVVNDTVLGVIESSPILDTQADAVSWATNTSAEVNIALGVSANDPARVVSPGTAMAASTDDRANVNDATHLAALNLFTKDLGPGQVMFTTRTTSVAHGQLMDNAAANNRVALLDLPDTTSKASILAALTAIKAHVNARFGIPLATWVQVPGIVFGTAPRDLQPSAVVAGIIGRNDSLGVSPNQAPAGAYGDSATAINVKNSFPLEQDRSDLNDAGGNLLILRNGTVRVYGFRSALPRLSNPNWWQAANARLYMAIAYRSDQILESYVERMIDGRGVVFSNLKSELTAMVRDYYDGPFVGSLYGATPDDAFFVDVGSSVNTTTTIANGEIHAVIELTMSATGETVILDIVKRRIGG